MDNIFTERLWRSLKYQEVYLNEYNSPLEARAGITRYFDLYNTFRPHQGLDGLTPHEVYFGTAAYTVPGSDSALSLSLYGLTDI